MMLDNHRIVIRERGYLELLDLGLRVLRSQAGPFFLALLAGVGPFVVLNAWLLNRAAAVPAGGGPPWLFLFLMLIAVLWELPLATAPATMCLGRALFNQPLKAGQIAREFAQSLPQLIFYQVLLRGLLMATVAGSFVPFIRQSLLERSHSPGTQSAMRAGRRGRNRYRPGSGVRCCIAVREAISSSAGFSTMVIGLILVAAFWGSLAAAARWLLNEQEWSGPVLHLPVSGHALDRGRLFHRRAVPRLS